MRMAWEAATTTPETKLTVYPRIRYDGIFTARTMAVLDTNWFRDRRDCA